MGHYERLSFLDSTFLAMEGPTNPMHVGATLVFEAGPLRLAGGRLDIDRVRDFIGARLQHIPRYRQRLQWIPIERHPVWVDDEHFNLNYHVRHTALPRPGTEDTLKRLAGRVFGQQLHRSKPLWEVWVAEGLSDDRFALVTKVHHCMIDGMAGVDILKVMLSPFANSEIGQPDEFEPLAAPSSAELLCDEAIRRIRIPLEASRSARRFVEETREFGAELRQRLNAMTRSAMSGWFSNASLTPINQRIGPNRRVEFLSTSLDDVKAVKNALGGTVNDVVIATVAGAMRRFLMEDRDVDVTTLDFRAMIPVSTRSDDQAGDLGNQVTMWLIDLPLADPDPVSRLRKVSASTLHLKQTDQALGAAMLIQSASWTPGTLLSVAARMAAGSARPFNITITNVPGPQVPLYLMESPMVANYPMVPLWVNHGVGIALFSYNGSLDWGLVSDWDLVPDVDRVATHLRASFDELLDASKPKPRRTAAKKPAGAKKPARAKKPAAEKPAGRSA